MSDLPCKTNKCITYPACRNREYILCDHLKDYLVNADVPIPEGEKLVSSIYVQLWDKYIKKFFPNLRLVSYTDRRGYIIRHIAPEYINEGKMMFRHPTNSDLTISFDNYMVRL